MITQYFHLSMLVSLLAVLIQTSEAAELDGIDWPIRINRNSFGLHVHGLGAGNPWPRSQFGLLRLWDSETTWRDLQKSEDRWDFSTLDSYVAAASVHSVELLMTLGQTPQWAAEDPFADSPYGEGASSPPKDLSLWRDYVATLGHRYKGRIKYWEVWNEVNVPHFWRGSLEDLVALERIAKEVLSSIDPENVVLTPSVQGGAYGFLERYFDRGGGKFADAISYHFYAPKEEPELVLERIKNVRKIIRRHDLSGKELWNTEFGWLLVNSDGRLGRKMRPAWGSWKQVSYADSGGVVLRALVTSFAGGIERAAWYAWNNAAMGLAEDRGRRVKPAAAGFDAAFDWLVGSDFYGCTEAGGVWVCRAVLDAKDRYIVWDVNRGTFVVPLEWNVNTLTQLSGLQSLLSPGERISLAGGPVLLSVEY